MANLLILGILIVLFCESVNLARLARCFVVPSNDSLVSGLIHFYQENANSEVKLNGKIFGANKVHAFHIHENSIADGLCSSADKDYNPTKALHGARNATVRHFGDLGNVYNDGYSLDINFSDKIISLYNEYSIIGKTCVIHLGQDDEGLSTSEESKESGNSGKIVACGVVQNHFRYLNYILGFFTLIVPLIVLAYYAYFRKQ